MDTKNKKFLLFLSGSFLISSAILFSSLFFGVNEAKAGAFGILSPNGGENWVIGNQYSITWFSSTGSGDVWIKYSDGSGNVYFIGNGNSAVGRYDWTIPSNLAPGNTYKIEVVDLGTGNFDWSDNYFSISAPTITVTISGNTSIEVNKAYTYTFTTQSNTQESALTYKVNWGDGFVTQDSGPNGGSKTFNHSWTSSGIYTITFTAASPSNTSVVDVATLAVKVSQTTPSITVTSPNGGENWVAGNQYSIFWTSSTSSGDVIIKYTDGSNNAYTIGNGNSAVGRYDWTIPSTLTPGNKYKIEVAAIGASNYDSFDWSDNYFTISAPKGIATVSGYTSVEMNKTYTYTFTTQSNTQDSALTYKVNWGDGSVTQDSGPNGGSKTFSHSWASSGIYTITFSAASPLNTLVLDVATLAVKVSTYITGTIQITSPVSGSIYKVGDTVSILWSMTPPGGVTIWLYRGNTPIATLKGTGVEASNQWTWVISSSLGITQTSSDYKIKIIGIDYPSISGETGYFTIAPVECLTSNDCKELSCTGGGHVHEVCENSKCVLKASCTTTPLVPTGQCLPDNTLVKLPDDPKVYVIKNCKKEWIETVEEFNEEGYKWSDVKEVSSPVLQAYGEYLQAATNLLRAIGQQRVYRIVDGKILWVPTIAAFNAQGLKWEDIQDVNESTVNQYPSLKLVRVKGDPKVYYLTESGLKRWIPTIEVFNSYNNKWEDVVELESKDVNGYSNNDLIKLENEAKVYKLENGKKRWIETIEAFNKLGLDWNKIAPVNQTELNFYPEGAVIE